ncbi:CBS domain-containing protein [Motiliproteus sp. SC1-56]|uniref:CBS domain-containing protein n=1 Tax=Motiliproteus sp. SC1-56 TaxID=2799565 RepID=UPI001A8CCCEC|nr:CBS domain-containing protein [Motiliproteus sp. SC1-56]
MRSVKVSDYMTKYVVTFTPDTDLFKAIGTLLERKISAAPVLDKEGKVVGILTEWDCLQRILRGSYHEEVGGRVGDCMSTDVHCIAPNDGVIDVAETMTAQGWRRSMPVMDNGKLVGILSCPDVLRVVYDFDEHTGEPIRGRA